MNVVDYLALGPHSVSVPLFIPLLDDWLAEVGNCQANSNLLSAMLHPFEARTGLVVVVSYSWGCNLFEK